MSNLSDEIINVETFFYKDSISQGIPCTSTIIEPKSTKILPLLNRKWDHYFNNDDQDSYLEVIIMKMSKDEYNSDKHVQRLIDKKILNGEFKRYNLILEELNKKEWILSYPLLK
jgi:hypothetical protein